MSLVNDLRQMEQQVTKRLQELEPLVAEYEELRTIAERIGEQVASAAAPAPAAARPPAARKRAAPARARRVAARGRRPASTAKQATNGKLRGKRDEEIIRMVTQQPGITVAQVGKELGVDPTGLYRVVRRLQASGYLRKQGTGLTPAG